MKIKDIFWKGTSFLAEYGVLGKTVQIVYFFAREWNPGLKISKNEWKKSYIEVKEKYSEIRVHKLWSTRIGEYLVRYFTVIEDSRKNLQNGVLDVFVLTDCVNHNARLSEIMGRNIPIVDKKNWEMWVYILSRFRKVKFASYWNLYQNRNKEKMFNSDYTVQYLKLTEEEEQEGKYKMDMMGIRSPFVCIASRDTEYLSVIQSEENTSYQDYRDSDINRCNLLSEYLLGKGITTVRMGRYVKNKVNFNNCIDYANEYYDELMDIVLMKNCKFFLGDSTGITWLPMALNRPVAIKNLVPVFLDSEAFIYNSMNLYIFKKYYLKTENRFLSIKEMMKVEKEVRYNGCLYEKFHVEVVENSEEEILDLAIEMNARIDGKWKEEKEDIELQKKYQRIYKEWYEQENYVESARLDFKVGALFLRKNSFLLS